MLSFAPGALLLVGCGRAPVSAPCARSFSGTVPRLSRLGLGRRCLGVGCPVSPPFRSSPGTRSYLCRVPGPSFERRQRLPGRLVFSIRIIMDSNLEQMVTRRKCYSYELSALTNWGPDLVPAIVLLPLPFHPKSHGFPGSAGLDGFNDRLANRGAGPGRRNRPTDRLGC